MQRLHSRRKAAKEQRVRYFSHKGAKLAKEEKGYAPISHLRIDSTFSFVLLCPCALCGSVAKPLFRGFGAFRGSIIVKLRGEALRAT